MSIDRETSRGRRGRADRAIGVPRMRLLPLFLLLIGTLAFAPQDQAPPDDPSGVPIPKSEPGWHCPAQKGAQVVQGNGGAATHFDDFNRYAWDYDLPPGSPVVASRSGVVSERHMLSNIGGPDASFAEDANRILIRHTDGTESYYVHLSKGTALVRPGEFVLQGELIALSGATGAAEEPHLHYDVRRDGISTPTRFSDFPGKDGIPDVGASHSAPSPPRVPQAMIGKYRDYVGACAAADERGWPDLGLALIEKTPRGPRYSSYYNHQVLAAYGRRFQEEVDALTERLLSAEDLTGEDLLLLARLRKSLKPIRGMKETLKKLAARVSEAPVQTGKEAVPSGGLMKRIVQGMWNECLEDYPKARSAYLSAARKGKGPSRRFAMESFRRLIDRRRLMFGHELDRLKDEAARCLPKDRAVVRRDAERLAKEFTSLIVEWAKHVPDDREEAQEILGKLEADRQLIMEKTR